MEAESYRTEMTALATIVLSKTVLGTNHWLDRTCQVPWNSRKSHAPQRPLRPKQFTMHDPPATHPNTPQFRLDETPLPVRVAPRTTPSGLETDLVDQTKNQIRALVQEISDLAKSNCSSDQFYEGFLRRTTSALASLGGVIWTRSAPDQPWRAQYHINFQSTVLALPGDAPAQHLQLLNRVAQAAEPTLIPPHSGGGDSHYANPSEFLLIFAPLIVDQSVVGLVEILQRAGSGPATQRGYLRFLSQMSEIANDFLKSQRLKDFAEQHQFWRDLESFARLIHQSLDLRQVAYHLANEGRRLTTCDRVSVAVRESSKLRVLAVSGLDSLERRADQIKRLNELTQAVARTGKPLWYEGPEPPLPPQIEQPLHAYLDSSQSKFLAVLPLFQPASAGFEPAPLGAATESSAAQSSLPPGSATRRPATSSLCGALIVEQIHSARLAPSTRLRIESMLEHARAAIANAQLTAPFLSLQRTLGWMLQPFQQTTLPKTFLAGALAGGFGLGLCLLPYPFELAAKGKLRAETQQEVYAHVDGTLTQLFESTRPGGVVEAGDPLARLTNNQLQLQIERLQGEFNKTTAQIDNLQHQRLDKPKGNNRETERRDRFYLESELAKAEALQLSLSQELQIAHQQADLLEIRSPLKGEIVDWELQRHLLGRPVNRGDKLMTVVAPDSQFQIELYIPEKRFGHLLLATQRSADPLAVRFSLASDPGREYSGVIVAIDAALEVHEAEGNCGRVVVQFDNQQAATDILRTGTRVTAKVHCGTRPAGYVLFHELWDSIRGFWNFWF